MESNNVVKELPQVGIWVPLTPSKLCSESGESNGKDSIFCNSNKCVDSNGGLCDGGAVKLGSSDEVGIKFGAETYERKCTEKESQRMPMYEDAEMNFHSAENSKRNLAFPVISTPPSSEKQNNRKRHSDIDLNMKPKQRPKVKKHRPKIAGDRWQQRKFPVMSKSSNARTPRQLTPKNLKPSTPKHANLCGKRYSRKPSNPKGLTSKLNFNGEAISESSTFGGVSCRRTLKFEVEVVGHGDDMLESCNLPRHPKLDKLEENNFSVEISTPSNAGNSDLCPNFRAKCTEGFSFKMDTEVNTCLEFKMKSKERDKGFRRFYYQYARRKKSVEKNIGLDMEVQQGKSPSFNTEKEPVEYLNEMETATVIDLNNLHGKNKSVCLQFYKRLFRANQCPQNSKKSGPNFPKIYKRSRMRRRKATAFWTMWSILEAAYCGCKQVTWKILHQKLSWKVLRKGIRSRRKPRYWNPYCGFQIEKEFLQMILPTESQTHEAIEDPESFKCVVALIPVAKSRKKRSKAFIPRNSHNLPIINFSFFEFPQLHLLKNYGGMVYEPQSLEEVRVIESESYSIWREDTKMLYNDDPVSYDLYMDRGHCLKEIRAPEKIPFAENENCSNCTLNTTKFLLNDGYVYVNETFQPDINCLDVAVYSDGDYQQQHQVSFIESKYSFVKGLMDVIRKLKCLNINDTCHQLVMRDHKIHKGTLTKSGDSKKRKILPKVALDSETLRMFKLVMENDGTEYPDDMDNDKKEWWAKEREVFRGRANSFIARMHLMQGDRRFSKWKGSVVDSVVGVFLTQNVTDILSSSAFINLAAQYPLKPKSKEIVENWAFECSEEPVAMSTCTQGISNNCTDVKVDIDGNKFGQPTPFVSLVQNIEGSICEVDLIGTAKVCAGESSSFRKLLEYEENDFLQQFYGAEDNIFLSNVNMDMGSKSNMREGGAELSLSIVPFHLDGDALGILKERDMESVKSKSESSETMELLVNEITTHHKVQDGEQQPIPFDPTFNPEGEFTKKDYLDHDDNVKKKSTRGKGSSKVQKKKDWEEVRKTYYNPNRVGNDDDTMHAVDWEAVRNAKVEEIAYVISKRGMSNVLAPRIKDFLERLVKDHGNIDLEWLRDIPPDDSKEFLLSIEGLGLKSVECIRLLTLHHRAFPVDTNVGRVVVRLGWVPLAPLPEELKLHLLDSYPLLDKIQIYLFPRLCTLDQETLYQLHYQLITFGKVYCTKKNPNCIECPMRGECKHYASSIASSQLALPWLKDKGDVASNMSAVPNDKAHTLFIKPPTELFSTVRTLHEADPNLSESKGSDPIYRTQNCEPIIEVPESPKPESIEPPELRDIEDLFMDSEDEIPIIRLNEEQLKKNLQNILESEYNFLQEVDITNALTALTKVAGSPSPPKLKFVEKSKTVHQVFELPDFHPLLEQFEQRVIDDLCPYLLAIWTTGIYNDEDPGHVCSTNLELTVKGTILIPCRTAMRGRFPLNGTYFQVNEVFADYESSENPIDVPKAWICNLPRRSVHCGTSTTAIFKGACTKEIQYCFCRGYICSRAFHKRLRVTARLHPRLHFSP